MPALATVGGDLYVNTAQRLTITQFPDLTTVSGFIRFDQANILSGAALSTGMAISIYLLLGQAFLAYFSAKCHPAHAA